MALANPSSQVRMMAETRASSADWSTRGLSPSCRSTMKCTRVSGPSMNSGRKLSTAPPKLCARKLPIRSRTSLS